MSTLRLSTSMSGGVSVSGSIDREADQQISIDPTLDAGQAGALTTRTDDDEGTLTLGVSHGITDAQVIDLYWVGGMRYGVVVGTVAGTAVPISGGAGDVLPADETAVVAAPRVNVVDAGIDGDNIVCLVFAATKRVSLDFLDSGGASLLHVEIAAGESYQWFTACGFTNPLAGDDVATVEASCGDSAAGTTLKGIVGYAS